MIYFRICISGIVKERLFIPGKSGTCFIGKRMHITAIPFKHSPHCWLIYLLYHIEELSWLDYIDYISVLFSGNYLHAAVYKNKCCRKLQQKDIHTLTWIVLSLKQIQHVARSRIQTSCLNTSTDIDKPMFSVICFCTFPNNQSYIKDRGTNLKSS
jgi:hypothetical protein